MLSLSDYQRAAQARLDPMAWDYIEGGSGAERTLAANLRAFADVRLRPRVLVDVSHCPTSVPLLGGSLPAPVGIAPMAYHQLAHPDGELATVRGAGGALFVVSFFASRTLEEIAAEATGPLWYQLYGLRRRDVLADLARRAAAAGYQALVFTVDVPPLGRRLRDLRNGFVLDPSIGAPNLPADLMAVTHQRQSGTSALATHVEQSFDPTMTWTDLTWLTGLTDLPVVVKGILTGEDAALAVEHGAAAVVVSNHGGRQLDRAVASLDVLAEVVDAVGGACPVLLDGGVRHGTDVFTALALGASAVLVGRPVLWALAAAGSQGVEHALGLLTAELIETMALTGRPDLTELDRSVLANVPGLGGSWSRPVGPG